MKLFKRNYSNKILIFGLGNPSKKYKKTRHNLGRVIVDDLADKYGESFMVKNKFNAEISEGMINNKSIIFARSQVFMNESGKAILALAKYYRLQPENIWIVHDDIDINFGKMKISRNRGSAGHKGIESIISYLGNNDFNRLRIGIWNNNFGKKSKDITQNYVLEKFLPIELRKLEEIKKEAISILIASI